MSPVVWWVLIVGPLVASAIYVTPALLAYRRACRDLCRAQRDLDMARREWDEHIATTPGLEPVERDFLRWEASLR